MESKRLVRFDADRQIAERCLHEHTAMLIAGQSGAGKTMAALDLATGFDGGGWRVLYLRADATQDVDRLVDGLLSMAFRPTIFVVDDCHLAFEEIQRCVYRIGRGAHTRRLKLVLTARTPPAGADAIEPVGTAFVARLREQGQVLEIVANKPRFRALIEARGAGWCYVPH